MGEQLVAVIDIDGVVADVRHRLHHVETRSERDKDWRAFFAAAAEDPLLHEGASTVRALAEAYDVVWLSGRPEWLREVTATWLQAHDLPTGPLMLRPRGDFRPGAVYKVDVLRTLRRERSVGLLVDDDPRVLASARQAGFDVLPATWMGEHSSQRAVLREAQEEDGRT